ncbi:MAG TPA: hypothetical protein VNN07_03940 [Candidatus Tectomicrobia bacterium]|nr:hypothetical protein [Candidatus Tectomicrobia bacterium]
MAVSVTVRDFVLVTLMAAIGIIVLKRLTTALSPQLGSVFSEI